MRWRRAIRSHATKMGEREKDGDERVHSLEQNLHKQFAWLTLMSGVRIVDVCMRFSTDG